LRGEVLLTFTPDIESSAPVSSISENGRIEVGNMNTMVPRYESDAGRPHDERVSGET